MRCVCSFLLCLFVSSFAFGQDSRADLFGGYSYLSIDTNGLTTSRQNANGWEASISGNFNRWFATEADVAGYYKTFSGVSVTDYSYGAGPRFNFKPVFVHALIGGDHLTGSESGMSLSQDSLAGAFGGGVQWKVSGPFSIRGSADYVFTRHNILGGPSVTQNNVRISAGIVYSFGRAEHATVSPRQSAPRAPSAGMKISTLGVIVAVGNNPGAEITDEAPNGIAAMAGIHVGDVINAVDGKPVSTPMELAAELANRPARDKVRIGFLIRGQWQKETMVVLP
jgi:membrane-associated protease RseP (regulator of RpoE activity)